ncbi:MAG: hypothetical protein H6574_17010 [Lewinellaceae bacterium]|nr:hypothetical protein [Saprospiraceae bacterium]MCB9316667.1 hypothetical protein [Lewinellaceae bacterium]MCB9332774.1 hypothetical protein [Lewinellaceae bacterium]
MLFPGFALLLTLLVIFIFTGISNADIPAPQRRKYVRNTAAIAALWLMYVATLAGTGFLRDYSPPPRIALFLILPAFVFIAYFFFSKKFEDLIRGIPPAWPVYLQTFRIGVELLILGIYLKGLAPVEPTLEGYNFDILAGITAPVVAYWGFQRKLMPSRVLKLWNYLGLLLLANVVSIFMTLILKPALWGYPEIPIRPEFGTMPYMLIPSVLMPLAVFLHFFSLAQLRGELERG